MHTKTFALADLLSVTTGYLVSPRGMIAVSDVLNYVTGDQIFDFQFGRVAKHIRPHLLAQHPWLDDITVPKERDNDGAWVDPWVEQMTQRYGANVDLAPLPLAQRVIRDPITEASELFGDRLIVIDTTP